MYCKRCDRDDVGSFHRCFVLGKKLIRPLKSKPTRNTRLARKLAEIYKELIGEEFPGGIGNAMIMRDYLGMTSYRSDGAWTWSLISIDIHKGLPRDFGSPWAATKCVKNTKLLDV